MNEKEEYCTGIPLLNILLPEKEAAYALYFFPGTGD